MILIRARAKMLTARFASKQNGRKNNTRRSRRTWRRSGVRFQTTQVEPHTSGSAHHFHMRKVAASPPITWSGAYLPPWWPDSDPTQPHAGLSDVPGEQAHWKWSQGAQIASFSQKQECSYISDFIYLGTFKKFLGCHLYLLFLPLRIISILRFSSLPSLP